MTTSIRHRGIGVLASFVFVAAGCAPKPVAAPTSFQNWTPNEAYFHMQYPEGWQAEGGGKQGLQWAEFSKGACKISASTDVASSVIGDIAGSTGQLPIGDPSIDSELRERLAPVASVHELNLKRLPEEYKTYKEEKAEVFKSKLAEGRKSAFTAKMGLGRKIKGYRATVLALNRGITVFCYCPEKDWSKLQPAFDTVLESIAQGGL